MSESDLEVGIRLRIFNLKNDLFLTVNFSPFLNFLFRLCFAKIQIVLFYSQFVLYPFYNLLITVPVYLKKGTDSFFSHKNRFKLLRFNSCFMTFFGQIRIRNWIRTIWQDPTKKARIRLDPDLQHWRQLPNFNHSYGMCNSFNILAAASKS